MHFSTLSRINSDIESGYGLHPQIKIADQTRTKPVDFRMSELLKQVHRRYNPLRKSWVLVSPHRTSRPWQGDEETIGEQKPEYDPKCYLCPGNTRANGEHNPKYESTFMFPNDFAAVVPRSAETAASLNEDDGLGLFRADPVVGKAIVICFSPKHNLTLAQMNSAEIQLVIKAWQDVYRQAVADPDVKYCQIFENKGSAMGASNPHPHGQVWMTSEIPDEPQLEHEALVEYAQKHPGHHLLEDYVAKELKLVGTAESRVVDQNDSFAVLVPFWATWPFETMLVSKKRIRSVVDLTEKEAADLAEMLSSLTVRYDNLFKTSFPYSMGIHQAFVGGNEPKNEDVEHLMFHFYPPLLRSATVRKFLVGFELLAMPQRDITPETAAQRLRDLPTVHYLDTAPANN